MPGFTIRGYEPDDRAGVTALHVALQQLERTMRPSRAPGVDVVEPYMSELEAACSADDGKTAIFVAVDGCGSIVGFAACEAGEDILEQEPREVMFRDLFITEEWRARGVGRALSAAVLAYACEHHAARVLVSFLQENDAARSFYWKVGFRPAIETMEIILGED